MFYELENAVKKRADRDELIAVSKRLLTDDVTVFDLVSAFNELISNITDNAYSCMLSEICDIFETKKNLID